MSLLERSFRLLLAICCLGGTGDHDFIDLHWFLSAFRAGEPEPPATTLILRR